MVQKLHSAVFMMICLFMHSFIAPKVLARPTHLEFWFLKEPKTKSTTMNTPMNSRQNSSHHFSKVAQIFADVDRLFYSKKILNPYLLSMFSPFKARFAKNETTAGADTTCTPMEGGCFHPQHGFIERMERTDLNSNEDGTEKSHEERQKQEDEILNMYRDPVSAGSPDLLEHFDTINKHETKSGQTGIFKDKMKTFNSDEVNEVKCEKGNYFDIYCGKSGGFKRADANVNDIEVWIDTSSSMKSIDFPNVVQDEHEKMKGEIKREECFRLNFVQAIKASCGQKVRFSVFDTTIKEVMSDDAFCINYGLNDTKRLIDWIKGNKAKHLIVITDVSEISTELTAFLREMGATTKGIDAKDFFAKDLMKEEKSVRALCK